MNTLRSMWFAASVAMVLMASLLSCGGRRSEQFRQQGDTMLELGKLEEASDFYAQALESDPENAGAVVGQGKILAAQKKYDDALEKFREALRMEASNAAAYDAAVATLLAAGRRDEALAMAEQYKAVDDEKASALIASINSAETLGPDMAPVPESTAPAQPAPTRDTSTASAETGAIADWDVLWRQGALSELLEHRAQWANSDDPKLKQILVMAAVFMNDVELAEELAAQLPEDSKVREYLEVMQQNDLNALVEFMKTWDVNAEDAFEASLHHNALAYALAKGGARARAIQILSQTLESYPDYRVTMANVAGVFRAARMPEQETRVLQRWVLDAPENMDARTMLFERLRRSGEYDDARQAAEVAFSLYPENQRANLNLAQAYLDSGQHEAALTTLDRALDNSPDDIRLSVARAEVLLHGGEAQQALDMLSGLDLSQARDDAAYRALMVQGFALAALGKWEEVLALRPQLEQAPEGQPVSVQYLLAAASIHLNQPQDAIEILSIKDPARDVAAPLSALILNALGQEQQLAVGQELVEPLKADPPSLADFTYALALKAAGLHKDSLAILRRVEEKVPPSSLLVDLIARALLQGLTIENRLEQAQAVADKYAEMPVAWIGLALLAESLENEELEREALDKAAEVGPEDPLVWMHRGQYFSRRNMIPEAMEAFRKQLALAPDDPMANNNLAYYLTLTGENMEEALQRAQAAKDKLGPNPNVLHTLGVAQLRTDNLEDSQENLAVALEMRPGEPTLLLDFGQLLIKLGKEEEGRKRIEDAVKYADLLGLDFPRREEAIQILGAGQQESSV